MMNEDNFVIYEIRNKICTITLNNPKIHNAFNEKIIIRLTNILESINQNDHVRVVIIRSEGKHFSAGADLNWMQKTIHFSKEQNKADALRLSKLLETLNRLNKPTIALPQGSTFGGGIGLLACCDIVIAEKDAKFCFSEAKVGLIPATIAPYIIRSIGYSSARYYFLTTEIFSVDVAKQMHLIHDVCDKDKLSEKGQTMANTLLENGPYALSQIKNLVNHIANIDNNLIEDTANLLAEIRVSEESQEGVNAFLNKRQPSWKTSNENV